MNITYVVGSFPKLSETFILDQITYLIDQGHSLRILAANDPQEEIQHKAVSTYALESKTTYMRTTYAPPGFELSENVLEAVAFADVIHAHFAKEPAENAMTLAEIVGVPFVFTAHAYDIFIAPDQERLHALATSAQRVLTISDFNKSFLVELLGESFRDKIEIVRCSIDLQKVHPRHPENRDVIKALSCGRLVEKKGIEFAIRAVGELPSNVQLVLEIIGDGPLRAALEDLVLQLNLQDRVNFLGAQTHEAVLKHIKDADIFLLPCVTAGNGDREGIPVVLLEAQAAGVPVISTVHTGIPEGVLHNESGFLVPERDVHAIALRLRELAEDQQERIRMGRQGRRFIRERYNSLSELPKMEEVLKEAASKGRQSPSLSPEQERLLSQRISQYVVAQARHLTSEICCLREELAQADSALKISVAEREALEGHVGFLNQELRWMRRHITWRMTDPLRRIIGSVRSIVPPRVLTASTGDTAPDTVERPEVSSYPRKVLYLLNAFPKLSETFVLNEIVELLSRGVDVQIIAMTNPCEAAINRKVLSYNLMQRTRWIGEGHRKLHLNPSELRKLYGDVDLVHAHFASDAAILGAKIAKILGLPFTVTAHAYELFLRPNFNKLRHLFESASAVITPSAYNRRYISEKVGVDPEKVHIIRATIDSSEFSSKAKRKIRADTHPRLICIGRLVEKKGLTYLFKAMVRVLAKHPETTLHVIGGGPLAPRCQEEAEQLGIASNVYLLGDKSNEACLELISQSDVAVLPCIVAASGDRDVCPLTLQEAMAMELPVVSTTVASIPELVDHRVSGILVPERDSDALAKALIELIENGELARKMGAKGRVKIESEFNIKSQADLLLKMWKTLRSPVQRK